MDDHVDIVLISATFDKELLCIKYANDNKHKKVERLSFVRACIRKKKFKCPSRVPIQMGGRVGQK